MEVGQIVLNNQSLTFNEAIKEYKCEICEEIFTAEKILKRHFKTTHNSILKTKSHQCNICTKYFATLSQLTLHIKTFHEGHKNHKCESCGKSFSKVGQKDHKCESSSGCPQANFIIRRDTMEEKFLVIGKNFSMP